MHRSTCSLGSAMPLMEKEKIERVSSAATLQELAGSKGAFLHLVCCRVCFISASGRLPATLSTVTEFNLSTLDLPAGTIRVPEMVGQPSVQNEMSSSLEYSPTSS